MVLAVHRDPRWVDALLDWRWTWPLARAALTSAYWVGGVAKILDWRGAVAETEGLGLHAAALAAALTILVEIGGSVLLITGRWVWLGAGALGVFTALANLVANDFWNRQGLLRAAAMNGFLEHVGLIAGLVLAALVAEHLDRGPKVRIVRRGR
jgi:uncharacterized membrane protein YphA (DoxX/SURF4 family)